MKRLVNSYSVNRAIATLSNIGIERDHLVLWTILSLRWPELSEYLEKNPSRFEEIINGNTNDLPGSLNKLCNDGEVRRVLEGDQIANPLNESVIRQCDRLWV